MLFLRIGKVRKTGGELDEVRETDQVLYQGTVSSFSLFVARREEVVG